MTTIDAAAARRSSPRLSLVLALGLASLSLAGCSGSGSSLLSGDFGSFGSSIFGSTPEPVAEATPPPPPAPTQQPLAKIALAPIIGAPDNVARQIQQDFTNSVQAQRVQVAANKDERVDYTLRGYLVAAKEKNNTKVSYIWDVTDATGKRVNRVTGEEVLPGGGSKDPWAALTPDVAQTLAGKAANSFASWLSTQSGQTPIASAQPPQPSGVTNTASVPDAAAAGKKKNAPTPAAAAATPGVVMAMVPRVTGAPGDGSQSLSEAIRQELSGKGVSLSETPSASTYRVEGSVKVGEAKDNKQPIQIEWVVKDPQGKKLGTVSQRNEIPAGSLDGEWGATAQQAAGAAVQGIVKLLPGQKTASNG